MAPKILFTFFCYSSQDTVQHAMITIEMQPRIKRHGWQERWG